MKRAAASALLVAAAGCAEEPEPVPLFDLRAWEAADPDEDPWADLRPEGPDCSEAGVRAEGEELELDTGACGWFTLKWASGVEVAAGDEVHLLFFHAPLAAVEPAEALAELRFGAHTVWSETVPIPQDAQVFDVTEPAGAELAVGDTVWFHLHNHGSNTWRLSTLERLP